MALAFTRKDGESFYLILEDGLEIIIQVESEASDTTKVRVTAPNSVQILREELLTSDSLRSLQH